MTIADDAREDGLAKDSESKSAEQCKQLGSEAYVSNDWKEAVRCYTEALKRCGPETDLATTCLNNRAACYAQLRDHGAVVADATMVISKQPANLKALLRRMVALEEMGRREEALEDAGSVLTMEPSNPHALQVVARKRQSLTKKATDQLPQGPPDRPKKGLAVFLFSEDRPLQCYACLRSLQRSITGVVLNVHVFWQAKEPSCIHSYQLLQGLRETSALRYGRVQWSEISHGQLLPAFSRSINRLSTEGLHHLLLLSDSALFHSPADVGSMLSLLDAHREAFAARLDVCPRVEYFPEAEIYQSAPKMKPFSGDPGLLLWTRSYDSSRQAYEAVPRESGWDAILDWTATIVRTELVQHFFSALVPPINTVRELDDKAADWLSRRQRMKHSELSHRSACFAAPVLVSVDSAQFGTALEADLLLRRHLLRIWGPGSQGRDRRNELARELGWTAQELTDYFQPVSSPSSSSDASPGLSALLQPEHYRDFYLESVRVALQTEACGLPQQPPAPRPLVSWLVPVRNSQDLVLDCLASIEAQHGMGAGSYEVVLVEDASEDGSLALLRRFAESRPFVRVFAADQQRGLAGSLRAGWPCCRGDFVARLDADDEAEPDRLLKQLGYLQQHRSISVLGGRARPFWTEERKCTIEKVSDREGGRLSAVAWREFHGNQTSRSREQLILALRGHEVIVEDGPAELHGCRVVRVGEEPLALALESAPADRWCEVLRSAQGGTAEVLLLRRDPPEPPTGGRALHPLLVRANLIFEDCVVGTTAVLRKDHFRQEEGPFPAEEAEGHWCWLSLDKQQHAANIADSVVRSRRHEGNRAVRDATGIYESACAAVQFHLTKVHGVNVDMHDAAALLRFRGPRTSQQGLKLLEVLGKVERNLIRDFIRPKDDEGKGEFWQDFVQGREVALERNLAQLRQRFKAVSDEVSAVITNVPEFSPRNKRSRTPPR